MTGKRPVLRQIGGSAVSFSKFAAIFQLFKTLRKGVREYVTAKPGRQFQNGGTPSPRVRHDEAFDISEIAGRGLG